MISKDMTIGEIIHNHPYVAELIMEEGVHCVGCGAAYWETLEEGFAGHGKTPEDIDRVVNKLNEAITYEESRKEKTDGQVVITPSAAQKVKQILAQDHPNENGLRIEVVPGGCSGYKYDFNLEHQQKENDKIIEIEGVKFYLDPKTLDLLKGATIDYVESLSKSGFEVKNPNAKSECGCGESFS